MSDKSFLTIPIEQIYRILDNLDDISILLSAREVCKQLNAIIDTYPRYQVNFTFILHSDLCFLGYRLT